MRKPADGSWTKPDRVRVLIDNCLPVDLRHSIEGHEVETAAYRGWGQLENGELIKAAVDAGFEAIVTIDQGGEFRAAVRGQPILAVLLPGRDGSRLRDVLSRVPQIHDALETGHPGEVYRIGGGRKQRLTGE